MPLVPGGAIHQPIRLANRVMSLRAYKTAWDALTDEQRTWEGPGQAQLKQQLVEFCEPVIARWHEEEQARRDAARAAEERAALAAEAEARA